MTFNEFVKRFSTEEQCRDYLFQLRWPKGFKCPRCGGEEYRSLRSTLFDCKACKYQVSVIAGTIFQDTRTPLTTWFTAILKRWLLGTHQGAVSEKHIQAYLDEYTFRFNRRTASKRGLLFYRLLECAVNCSPYTYDNIVHPSKPSEFDDF